LECTVVQADRPTHQKYCSDILDNVIDAVFTVDPQMNILSYNKAAELMSGVSTDQAIGRKCYHVFKTAVCEATCPVREAMEKNQKVVTREIVMQDYRGGGMPVLLKASVLYDEHGNQIGGVETMRCLRRLYSIIDSVADGLFTVNNKMQITNYNKAAEELTGVPHEEALGKSCREVFKSNCCQQGECLIQMAIMTGQSVQRDIEIVDRNGAKKLISANASILFDCTGAAIGGVKTLRDLTPIVAMKEEIQQKYTFRRLVSRNSAMRKLFSVMEDVATSNATVFLYGESGTGKELLAHAIHDLSLRRNGPLVTVNCGALPETLLEAEIFGVRKGAYTGATENRPGRVELCRGGTFFLDEIGDLPLQLQVKLLRLLENKEYQPLGARNAIKADVRFIAASHRNLEEMVKKGTFRQDLFFRINVVTLHIPPLRERLDDIPLLVDMALQRFNLSYGKQIRTVSPEVMQRFFAHPFPGNVRELLNMLEQACILCRGPEIAMEHMPRSFRQVDNECGRVAGPVTAHAYLAATRHEVGRAKHSPEMIADLLKRYQGNRNAVAQELGIDRTTLWRWMNRSGI